MTARAPHPATRTPRGLVACETSGAQWGRYIETQMEMKNG